MQNSIDSKKKSCKCPNCGSNMIMRWERLSKGLILSLVEMRKAVIALNRNKIHLQKDLSLTKNSFANFQKLRYHGLIAKYTNSETKQNEAGYWLLTKRGNLFCKNEVEISSRVLVFRNKIVERSDKKISMVDVYKNNELPFWDEKTNFEFEFKDISDVEDVLGVETTEKPNL